MHTIAPPRPPGPVARLGTRFANPLGMTKPKSPLRPFSAILVVALYVACGETPARTPDRSTLNTVEAPARPPSTLRPATATERKALDQVMTSLSVLLEQARADLAEDYASESHQRLVGTAQRELALDSLWLGAAPSGANPDVQHQEAWRQVNEVMNTVRMLMTFKAGDPQVSREALVQRAEEQLSKAREARRQMTVGA